MIHPVFFFSVFYQYINNNNQQGSSSVITTIQEVKAPKEFIPKEFICPITRIIYQSSSL